MRGGAGCGRYTLLFPEQEKGRGGDPRPSLSASEVVPVKWNYTAAAARSAIPSFFILYNRAL
jgi:hypothetical protein